MKLPLLVRRAHKWIGLAVGVQALLWMISGLYMVAVPIGVIHGDHLAKVAQAPLAPGGQRLAPVELARRYPGMQSFRLKHLLGRDVYEVRQGKATVLLDAATGAELSPLGRDAIRQLATQAYTGRAPIRDIEWITQAPRETGARPVPLWAVRYAGLGGDTLYYSPYTGELVARRHDLWRWFDFMWMLHIMDYEEREDVNNGLLRLASGATLLFALSGIWLLFYSVKRRRRA